MKLTGNITPTKIMSLVIFTGACITGVWLDNAEIIVLGILASAGLLGWRKNEQRKILTKIKRDGTS